MLPLYKWLFSREKLINNCLDIAFLILALVTLGCGILMLLLKQPQSWIEFFADDAFYYFGIARNVAEHGLSYFLPPFETNGYQPLWLILLSCSAWLFGIGNSDLALQAYSLSFGFVLLFFYASRKYYGLGYPAIIIALSLHAITLQGMETTMLPAFFVLFVNAKNGFFRGIFATLLFLTRLDALSLVIARDLYIFLRNRTVDYRPYLILLPAILIYSAFNYLKFGVPVPISGLAKSVGNHWGENFPIGLGFIKELKLPAVLFLVIAMLLKLNHKKMVDLRYLDELLIIVMALSASIIYYSLMSGWPIWPWYYWASFLLSFYLILEIIVVFKSTSEQNTLNFLQHCLCFCLLLGLLFILRSALGLTKIMTNQVRIHPPQSSIDSTYGENLLSFVNGIKNNTPFNSMIAMGDRAGAIGYFMGNNYRFLHTEGLVGPTSYYKAMSKDLAPDFTKRLDITYWIADREKFMENGDIIGLIEPVQGLSAHHGPYLICFQKSSIIFKQDYIAPAFKALHVYQHRYLFDMKGRIDCPDAMIRDFQKLRNQYGGVRQFTLPLEYKLRDTYSRLANMPW